MRVKVNTLSGLNNVLDIYHVNKYGNVFGADDKELKQQDNGAGYKYVGLKLKDKRQYKKIYVHRLVALAYIDNPDHLPEVNHKDEDKSNNSYTNLEWCTRQYNNTYGTKVSRMKQTLISTGKYKQCYVYDYMLNYIGRYNSLADASNALDITVRYNDSRVKEYYILSSNDLTSVITINKKSNYNAIVITDITTYNKHYFYSNRAARSFFNGRVNITQAIQNNWTVYNRYKVRNLNYKKLIDSLDL